MKIFLLGLLVIIGFTACSQKVTPLSDKVYERSNSASEKSLESLDRDTK